MASSSPPKFFIDFLLPKYLYYELLTHNGLHFLFYQCLEKRRFVSVSLHRLSVPNTSFRDAFAQVRIKLLEGLGGRP